jgi:hypothetical protein
MRPTHATHPTTRPRRVVARPLARVPTPYAGARVRAPLQGMIPLDRHVCWACRASDADGTGRARGRSHQTSGAEPELNNAGNQSTAENGDKIEWKDRPEENIHSFFSVFI